MSLYGPRERERERRPTTDPALPRRRDGPVVVPETRLAPSSSVQDTVRRSWPRSRSRRLPYTAEESISVLRSIVRPWRVCGTNYKEIASTAQADYHRAVGAAGWYPHSHHHQPHKPVGPLSYVLCAHDPIIRCLPTVARTGTGDDVMGGL